MNINTIPKYDENELKIIFPLKCWTHELRNQIFMGFTDFVFGEIKLRHLCSIKRDTKDGLISRAYYNLRERESITWHDDPNDRASSLDDSEWSLKSENEDLQRRMEKECSGSKKREDIYVDLDTQSEGVLTRIFQDCASSQPWLELRDVALGDTQRTYFECAMYVSQDGQRIRSQKFSHSNLVVLSICIDTFEVLARDKKGKLIPLAYRPEVEIENKNAAHHSEGSRFVTDPKASEIQINAAMQRGLDLLYAAVPDVREELKMATESKMKFAERMTNEYKAGKLPQPEADKNILFFKPPVRQPHPAYNPRYYRNRGGECLLAA